jgi:tRNA-dihydrouridine synthase
MTFGALQFTGNSERDFPSLEGRTGQWSTRMAGCRSYLKKHTEALVEDFGIEAACELTGKFKATLVRYYSDNDEHSDRFMSVDAVAALEAAATYLHVRSALAELSGVTVSFGKSGANSDEGEINTDVIKLSQRFALQMV